MKKLKAIARRVIDYASESVVRMGLPNERPVIDKIVWVSIPRSGSTYLCDLLSKHPEVYSCFEIFHRRGVFCPNVDSVIDRINDRYGTTFWGMRDPNLLRFTRERSADFIEALQCEAGARTLSYKVFPGHLRRWKYASLVLGDRTAAKVMFKRDLLSTFVSWEKAKRVKAWEHSETTNLKVPVDVEAFRDYVYRVTDWFAMTERFLRNTGQDYAVVDYEELVSIEEGEPRLRFVVEKLRSLRVSISSIEALALPPVVVERKKQDMSKRVEERIEDPERVKRDLHAIGLGAYMQ